MAKLMMGTEEVLKVMMGSEEVTSLFMGSEEIHFSGSPEPVIDYSTMPFTIEALGSGVLDFGTTNKYLNRSFYYSVNGGAQQLLTTTGSDKSIALVLEEGDTVEFTVPSNQNGTSDGTGFMMFQNSTCDFKAYGNIMSLCYVDYINNSTLLGNNTFRRLFDGCSHLKSVENLVMPSKTLTTSCYRSMFSYTEISYIKCLATDISASNCLASWLYSVSSTGTFVKDANTTWPSGADGIPTGWTVIDE